MDHEEYVIFISFVVGAFIFGSLLDSCFTLWGLVSLWHKIVLLLIGVWLGNLTNFYFFKRD